MADVDTQYLSAEHSDMRREAVAHTNEIVKENLKGVYDNTMATKDARHDVASRIYETNATLVSQMDKQYHSSEARQFELMRDLSKLQGTADLNRMATIAAVEAAGERASKDSQIAVLQNTIEGQKNTQFLADKISTEASTTRGLINELKNNDLNRMLIERSTDLIDERGHARHWRGHYDQNQFAGLTSQFQAFQSQLQDTKQSVINTGILSGLGLSNTAVAAR